MKKAINAMPINSVFHRSQQQQEMHVICQTHSRKYFFTLTFDAALILRRFVEESRNTFVTTIIGVTITRTACSVSVQTTPRNPPYTWVKKTAIKCTVTKYTKITKEFAVQHPRWRNNIKYSNQFSEGPADSIDSLFPSPKL